MALRFVPDGERIDHSPPASPQDIAHLVPELHPHDRIRGRVSGDIGHPRTDIKTEL